MVLDVLRRLCHWGPLCTLGIIGTLVQWNETLCSTHPSLCYETSYVNASSTCLQVAWLLCTYLAAVSNPPWGGIYEPTDDELAEVLQLASAGLPLTGARPDATDVLQHCHRCAAYKKPRAHHCSRCGVCVNKMDHHCPWINSCVWAGNHKAFTLFTLSVVVACGQCALRLLPFFYAAITRKLPRGVSTTETMRAVFAFSMQVGLVCAVGYLFLGQAKAIARNTTAVEEHVLGMATYWRGRLVKRHPSLPAASPMRCPYDQGLLANIRTVFPSLASLSSWRCILPGACANVTYYSLGEAAGAGANGLSHFSLSMEQISQRILKERVSMKFEAVRAWPDITACPSLGCTCCCMVQCCTLGLTTVYNYPTYTDSELGIAVGDVVTVARSEGDWYHGGIGHGRSRRSGWFPKARVRRAKEREEPSGFEPLENLAGLWRLPHGVIVFHDGRIVRSLDLSTSFVFRRRPANVHADSAAGQFSLLGVDLVRASRSEMVWANGEVWASVADASADV